MSAEVTAPKDMPEGYEFEATLADGTTQIVIVPEGGVKEGDTFTGKIKEGEKEEEGDVEAGAAVAGDPNEPKTGEWGAKFCNCMDIPFSYAWWMAWCCNGLALAQVQQRIGYGCTGSEMPESNAWKVAFGVWIVFLIIGIFLYFVWWAYTLAIIVILAITRFNFRKKYNLPVHETFGCFDGGCADCLASFFCTCCVILQMSEHATPGLADTKKTSCCAPDGLA